MYSWSQPLKSNVYLPPTSRQRTYRAFFLPYDIKLSGFCFDIRPFVPAPNQYRRCCQFRPFSYVCKPEHQVCSSCSSSHYFKQCSISTVRKCSNCSLPHSANWGGCPVRRKAAQKIINSIKFVPLRPRPRPTFVSPPSQSPLLVIPILIGQKPALLQPL